LRAADRQRGARTRLRALRAYVLPPSVAVLFSLTLSLVHAQDIGFDAARQTSQIDRLQAEQERLREAQGLSRATGAPDGARVTPPEMAASRPDETCIDVGRISVSGANLVSETALRRTAERFEGRCLGLAELNNVLESLTYLYVGRGYIASRAYLPAQDLSDGTLDVVVIEG